MPQETVYEEKVVHVQAPTPPPVYQEVVHDVQATPTYTDEYGVVRPAVPTKVRPESSVMKMDYRVIKPAENKVYHGQHLTPRPVLRK